MTEKSDFGGLVNAFDAAETKAQEPSPRAQRRQERRRTAGQQKQAGNTEKERIELPDGFQSTDDVAEGFAELNSHIESEDFREAVNTANTLLRVLGRKIVDTSTENLEELPREEVERLEALLEGIVDERIPTEFKKKGHAHAAKDAEDARSETPKPAKNRKTPAASTRLDDSSTVPGETVEDREARYAKYENGPDRPSFKGADFAGEEKRWIKKTKKSAASSADRPQTVLQTEQPLRVSPSSQPELDSFLAEAGYGAAQRPRVARPIEVSPDNAPEINDSLERGGFVNPAKDELLATEKVAQEEAIKAEEARQRLEAEASKKAEAEARKKQEAQDKKDEEERNSIFNTGYTKGAAGFADFGEAFDDKGFRTFIDTYERQNDMRGMHAEAIENGNQELLENSYERYAKARFVAAELSSVYANELGNLSGNSIKLPPEATQELNAYVARMLFEPGAEVHLEELYEQVQAFKEGPQKVEEAEAELQKELEKFNAGDISDLKDHFTSQIRERDVHLNYADKLEEMLKGKEVPTEQRLAHHRDIEVVSQGAIKKHYDKVKDYFDFDDTYTLDRITTDLKIKQIDAEDMLDELVQTGILEAVDSDENVGRNRQYRPVKAVADKISRPEERSGLKPMAGRQQNEYADAKQAEENKPLSWLGRYRQVGKLVEEGYITQAEMKGVGGLFERVFRSAKIIKATAEGIRNRHQAERESTVANMKDLETLESWELQTKKDYQLLRKNLLVHLEPSKRIRDAYGKELVNRIRQNLQNVTGTEDMTVAGDGNLSTLDSQQRILESVTKGQKSLQSEEIKLNRRQGVRYETEYSSGYLDDDAGEILDGSTLKSLQAEINESFKVTMAKKVADLLEKGTANMDTPYNQFEKAVNEILRNPSLDTAYGSVKGEDARNMILQILRDKLDGLKKKQAEQENSSTGPKATKSDFRILLLSKLINKLTKYGQAA